MTAKQVGGLVVVASLTMIAGQTRSQGKVLGWDPHAVAKADTTIATFKVKDKGLVEFFDKAYGYAVFPGVGKGAMGIGGAYGTGTVFQKGTPVGKTDLKQVTVGFQFGGQAYSEVIFFETKEAFENFQNGNLKFSGQASVVAVTLGASADLAYKGGVAVVTMAKGGLMYEASVGGQHFSYQAMAEKPKGEGTDKEGTEEGEGSDETEPEPTGEKGSGEGSGN